MSSCDQCGQTGTSLKKCARCQVVAYCSVDCQRSAWPSHKANCNGGPATSSASASAAGPAGMPSNLSGFRVQPSANQMSSDPQMADLQRQLLAKIMGEQMAAAGGPEAANKDPAAFKRQMQERVKQQMIAAGINPDTLAATVANASSTKGSVPVNAGPQRRRGGGAGAAPKNPFTGEEVDHNLGKHEMPFGMPGTFYGPDDVEDQHQHDDHAGHNHGGDDHGHSHGDGAQCGHNHGDSAGHNHGQHNHGGDGEQHNHGHGGASGHNHSHGGADGEEHNHGGAGHNHGQHNHGGAGHNHSQGGADGEEHNHGGAGHNHSHGGADGEEHNHGGAGHNHGQHNHGGADGEQHNHGHGGTNGHNHSHGGADGEEHNHGHGGANGHNHSHGGADGEEHNHGGAGHNHGQHNHGGADGHNHGDAQHNHGGNGHNHSHGGDDAASHNHSHGEGGAGKHNHGRDAGGHNDGQHNHGGAGGGAGVPANDPSQQKFGNKNPNASTRGNGKVATEDSPAAQAAHVYTQPSLQVLSEGVPSGLRDLASQVTVGPVRLASDATSAYQLLYSSSLAKRPFLAGLPASTSSLTYLPLAVGVSLDPSEQDIAERTGECHLCIMAMSPYPTKTPSREDMQMKQTLYANHVRVGRGLEKAFEEKEIVASNPPLSGAPAEVSQESIAPDCSIEMHSFQTTLKYINPLDKHYSCLQTDLTATPLDAARLQELQQTFGLGPSKSTLKKAKAKAKKAAAAAAAAAAPAPSSGGFLSSITSMFTGSATAAVAKPAEPSNDDDDDGADEEEAAALLAASAPVDEDDESKEDGAASSGAKKSKKKRELPSETPMTVVQVLVRCAPLCTSGEGFEAALRDKDPLKMYRFEFASPTPPAGAGADSAPPVLAAYQSALDFVMAFLHRTHPAPQPTAAQRAAFTVKDAAGVLRPGVMPVRMFPSHVSLWVDRSEWTGVPRTPFVARNLPGQTATAEQTAQALVPAHTSKLVNHNLYFTPASRTLDYATSKSLALAEQSASTGLLASFWKSYGLKEINLHVFPQGHSLYIYKSFQMIEAEVAARKAYFAKGKYRPKKLFQNERLDIQLQFEPSPEDIAAMEEARERKAKGLPPVDNSARIELEEDAEEEDDLRVPIQRYLVL